MLEHLFRRMDKAFVEMFTGIRFSKSSIKFPLECIPSSLRQPGINGQNSFQASSLNISAPTAGMVLGQIGPRAFETVW